VLGGSKDGSWGTTKGSDNEHEINKVSVTEEEEVGCRAGIQFEQCDMTEAPGALSFALT
jgi:hypothetical protein